MNKRVRQGGLLLLSFPMMTLMGCASWWGSDEEGEITKELPDLNGTVWQVEDIDNGGIIDNSMLTVAFNNEQVTGYTGCNRYFGSYEIVGSSITIRGLGNTRRSCPPAIDAQEQRFLLALRNATGLRMESDTWLLVLDDKNMMRLKMIEIDEDPTANQASTGAQFQAADTETVASFSCEGVDPVTVRFVGPETLEVTLDNQSEMLQRQPSSPTGAHYVGDTLEFRSDGMTGTLIMNDTEYPCRRDN